MGEEAGVTSIVAPAGRLASSPGKTSSGYQNESFPRKHDAGGESAATRGDTPEKTKNAYIFPWNAYIFAGLV